MKKNKNEVSAMSHNVWYVNTAILVVRLRHLLRCNIPWHLWKKNQRRYIDLLRDIESHGYVWYVDHDFFVIATGFSRRVVVKACEYVCDGVDSVKVVLENGDNLYV